MKRIHLLQLMVATFTLAMTVGVTAQSQIPKLTNETIPSLGWEPGTWVIDNRDYIRFLNEFGTEGSKEVIHLLSDLPHPWVEWKFLPGGVVIETKKLTEYSGIERVLLWERFDKTLLIYDTPTPITIAMDSPNGVRGTLYFPTQNHSWTSETYIGPTVRLVDDIEEDKE